MDSALANWIKKDQEERQRHREYMARKNEKDDKKWNKMIVILLTQYSLKKNDKIMILNFVRHKKLGKNLSPAQRSVVTNFYYKYTTAV